MQALRRSSTVTWALSLSVGRSLGQSACLQSLSLGFPLVTTSCFNVVVRVLEEEPETAKDIAPSSARPGSHTMETSGLIPRAVRGSPWPLSAGRKHGAKNRGFSKSHSHLRGPSETPASLSFPISKTDTLKLTGLVCPGKSKSETRSGASLSCSLIDVARDTCFLRQLGAKGKRTTSPSSTGHATLGSPGVSHPTPATDLPSSQPSPLCRGGSHGAGPTSKLQDLRPGQSGRDVGPKTGY